MPPLSILFILDHDTAFVFEEYGGNNRFILSEEEWEQSDKTSWEQYAAIVILAELSWKGKTLHDDFGITIGLDLRRKYKCLLPMVITSSMFQSFFELRSTQELQYNLLFARGTYFIPLLDAREGLTNVLLDAEPISLPLLTDMNEMLFNLRGVLLDTLGHRLQADMDKTRFHPLMQDMKTLLNAEQASVIEWAERVMLLENALGNSALFNALKSELLHIIQTTFPSVLSEGTRQMSDRRHTLLFVEDDDLFAAEAQAQLAGFFKKIIWTNDAEKAIRLLQNDKGNTITGLLCDWRLYKGNAKKYWQRQGYEVLACASQNHYTALFGITSLSDTNVHSIRNILGFDVHLFKKEQFIGSNATVQWHLMADVIGQKCDSVVQLIASEPSGANWQKLKSEYILKRNADWLIFETEIGTEAQRIFSFYKDAIEKQDARNVFSIAEIGLVLKGNLKNVLVVRRVFMGIYFLLNRKNIYLQEIRPVSLLGEGEKVDTGLRHHGIDAYSILRKDWWDDTHAGASSIQLQEEWEKFDQRIKNFRNVLCIDISELPRKGMLPEERAWMNQNDIDFSFLFNYWEDEN